MTTVGDRNRGKATVDELRELVTQQPPRDEWMARQVAAKLAPSGGFLAYGVLYIFVALIPAVVASIGAALLLAGVTGKPMPTWANVIVVGAMIVGFAAGWWPFARWVRHRRQTIALMIREGTRVSARVMRCTRVRWRGTPLTHVTLSLLHGEKQYSGTLSVTGHHEAIAADALIDMLFHPDVAFGAAFPLGGNLTPVRIRRKTKPHERTVPQGSLDLPLTSAHAHSQAHADQAIHISDAILVLFKKHGNKVYRHELRRLRRLLEHGRIAEAQQVWNLVPQINMGSFGDLVMTRGVFRREWDVDATEEFRRLSYLLKDAMKVLEDPSHTPLYPLTP